MAEDNYGRLRAWRKRKAKSNRIPMRTTTEFQNPYPWMSAIEARVFLALDAMGVPFTWRYFDGDAPNFTELLPNFTPEFTLKEYNIVILILGTYWGSLPGVLDTNSLAAAALEADGWKVVVLWQADIEHDVQGALQRAIPELRSPTILGDPRMPPTTPTYMTTRRRWLAAVGFRKSQFFDPQSGSWNDAHRRAKHRTRYRYRDRRARSSVG